VLVIDMQVTLTRQQNNRLPIMDGEIWTRKWPKIR
jgi:hypothetical protein